MSLAVVRDVASAAAGASGTAVTVAVPAGAQAGDDLIVAVSAASGTVNVSGVPAGWQLLREARGGTSTSHHSLFIWRVPAAQRAGAATYPLTLSQSRHWSVACLAVSPLYADTALYGGLASSANGGSNSASLTAPAVDAAFQDALVLQFGATTGQEGYTAPGGITELVDTTPATATTSGTTMGSHLFVGSGSQALAGTFPSGAWTRTLSTAQTFYPVVTLALPAVDVNRAPSVTASPVRVVAGQPFSMPVVASDPDGSLAGATYTWTALGSDPLAFSGQGTSTISGTAPTRHGIYPVTVQVTDAQGAASVAVTTALIVMDHPTVHHGNAFARLRHPAT